MVHAEVVRDTDIKATVSIISRQKGLSNPEFYDFIDYFYELAEKYKAKIKSVSPETLPKRDKPNERVAVTELHLRFSDPWLLNFFMEELK